MDTNALFYKIQKESVTTEDYIKWSHFLLANQISTPTLNIISSLSFNENIFEVEDLFKRASKEIGIQVPNFDTSARAYIAYLAKNIIKVTNSPKIFDLADKIYRIVVELQYPEALMEWYNISEMIDQLKYDDVTLEFNNDDVILKIKKEAKLISK
ncbi:hypothetical protein [Bacillus sp. CHD6a]|uniref:hypothetical protein n=1 Tax=Bacillus sp. CHD6a TaxID=1643452 RepID=UPI0006CCFAA3|nr:hypothetical protein [Bacillus sp. CHD6a]KPB05431.1 hypothetical protein AAV98_06735 [Bacillus sp. CHD6a]